LAFEVVNLVEGGLKPPCFFLETLRARCASMWMGQKGSQSSWSVVPGLGPT
jgi:hypothetical protein